MEVEKRARTSLFRTLYSIPIQADSIVCTQSCLTFCSSVLVKKLKSFSRPSTMTLTLHNTVTRTHERHTKRERAGCAACPQI